MPGGSDAKPSHPCIYKREPAESHGTPDLWAGRGNRVLCRFEEIGVATFRYQKSHLFGWLFCVLEV